MTTKSAPQYRLLCMDGGGIYGYFTVLMLKHFAKKYPRFLSAGHITAFAGTSAGALISLLLAKQKNPRDYLLSGELDDFFASDLLHGNKLDRLQSITSLMGLSTWCGGKDMEQLLKENFGDMTLGDLPSKVLIMTFDLSGNSGKQKRNSKSWKTKVYHNFKIRGNDLDVPAWFVAYGAACPATIRPVLGGISDGGIFAMSPTMSALSQLIYIARMKTAAIESYVHKVTDIYRVNCHQAQSQGPQQLIPISLPEGEQVELSSGNLVVKLVNSQNKVQADVDLFNEHLDHLRELLERIKSSDSLVSEEEYKWAQSGLRAVNPGQTSVLEFLDSIRVTQLVEFRLLEILNEVVSDPLRMDFDGEEVADGAVSYDPSEDPEVVQMRIQTLWAHARVCLEIGKLSNRTHPYLATLDNIQALSLGVGNFVPHYHKEDFNLGFLNFNFIPTNPGQKVWTPPALDMLYSPSTDHTDYEATQLLGDNYFRCNPNAIGWPTPSVVTALFLARFRLWRQFILDGIRKSFATAREELDECEAWIESMGWAEK